MINGDNFCKFCIKTYVVTPHLNRLDEIAQIRSTTYGFNEKLETFSFNYHQKLLLSRALLNNGYQCDLSTLFFHSF